LGFEIRVRGLGFVVSILGVGCGAAVCLLSCFTFRVWGLRFGGLGLEVGDTGSGSRVSILGVGCGV